MTQIPTAKVLKDVLSGGIVCPGVFGYNSLNLVSNIVRYLQGYRDCPNCGMRACRRYEICPITKKRYGNVCFFCRAIHVCDTLKKSAYIGTSPVPYDIRNIEEDL